MSEQNDICRLQTFHVQCKLYVGLVPRHSDLNAEYPYTSHYEHAALCNDTEYPFSRSMQACVKTFIFCINNEDTGEVNCRYAHGYSDAEYLHPNDTWYLQ